MKEDQKKKNKTTLKTNFFKKLFNVSNAKAKNESKKENHVVKDQNMFASSAVFWRSVARWFFVMKEINENPSSESFWQKTNLIWNEDIISNGDLSFSKLSELEKKPDLKNEILKILDPVLLEKWIYQKLQKHWNSFASVLSTVKRLDNPLEKDFYKLTALSFSHDFNSDFSIKEEKIKKLLSDQSHNNLIKIFKITQNDFFKHLISVFNRLYWNKNKVIINNIILNGFNLSNFSLWKKAKLKNIYFQNDGCTFDSNLLPNLLLEEKIDMFFIKQINVKSLKNFVFEEIFNYWKKIETPLKKIEDLNFFLNNETIFYKTKLDWERDFSKGVLKESAMKKIDFELSDQWKMMCQVDATFLFNFIKEKIIFSWNLIQGQIQKMKAYDSAFFTTKTWIQTGFDHQVDLAPDGSIIKPELIVDFPNERIFLFLNLKKNILDDYIREEISTHWKTFQYTLNKIWFFDEQALLDQEFWKKTQIYHKKDLNPDGDFLDFVQKKIPDWNLDKMTAIKKLKNDFLQDFLIQLILKHWKKIQFIVEDIRAKGYDCSDQKFWIFTNLNWHNDLESNGSLKKKTIKTLPYKTLNQIKAIKKLNKDFLESLLSGLEQGDQIQKLEKKHNFFWNWLFSKKKIPTLGKRLDNRFEVPGSLLVSHIKNYQDFKKNAKVYKKLKKMYNSRIIHNHEIVTVGDEEIVPTRYILEMYNVFKFYITDRKVESVIKDVSLKMEHGDFLVILGPSGAGKSTMLNIMSGIDSVDKGDLLIDGYNLALLKESGLTEFRRRYVGFVFQQYHLLQNLTCSENVEIGSSLLSNDKKSMDMAEIYQFLQIDKLLDKYPFQLSGGQQQRFSIARALSKNPELLFCDEPTGALDHKMSKKVMEILFDINQKYGTSIVLVTHNPVFEKLAKTVIYIENGTIVKIHKNENPTHPKNINFSFQKQEK